MEKMLAEKILTQVQEVFSNLKNPIEIALFVDDENCQYCSETRQLLEEVSAISDLIELKVYDLKENTAEAKDYGVDAAPVFLLLGKDGEKVINYGVRFMGIPSGHEFTSLINDILTVSLQDSGLSPETREFLAANTTPIHLQVFVTPTCPYCPRAVVLAHQMAVESPFVTADMVEATEFAELAQKYNVSGVPQTTINFGAANVVGAYPEVEMLAEIKKVLA